MRTASAAPRLAFHKRRNKKGRFTNGGFPLPTGVLSHPFFPGEETAQPAGPG